MKTLQKLTTLFGFDNYVFGQNTEVMCCGVVLLFYSLNSILNDKTYTALFGRNFDFVSIVFLCLNLPILMQCLFVGYWLNNFITMA
jgi:hypothetical protein